MTGTRKGEDTVQVSRWWLEDVRESLQGPLPSGRIGDTVFLLRDMIADILARPAPSPVGVDGMREALESIAADARYGVNSPDEALQRIGLTADTALASAPQSVAAKLDHEIEQDFALIKEALRIADEDRDIDTAQAEDALERISFIVAEAGWSAPAPSPSAGGALRGSGENSQSSLDEETIEAAKAVVAFDWSDNDDDAVAAVERLRNALKSKPSPQVGRGDHIDANEMVPAPKGMNEYERSIREKVFAAKILSPGEWVYLVGAFHALNETEHAPAVSGEGWMREAAGEIAHYIENDLAENDSGEFSRPGIAAIIARHFPAPDKEIVEALEFYVNPEIYKPHQDGLAFARRDLSYIARAALLKLRGRV